MPVAYRTAVAFVVGLLAASCTGTSDGLATSTTSADVTTLVTSTPASSTTTVATTTSTTFASITPPSYQIVERIEGEGAGDTVVVLLDPTSYDSLTDLDLFDIIAEVVELFPPIAVVHIVDDPAAANVVADPEADDAALATVSPNYLARLDNGFTITYLGPFASSGTVVLGS